MALTTTLRLTPEEFAEVCEANPDAVLELAADGSLIPMTPTGSETGSRSGELFFQIKSWARANGGWMAFDSSTGFRLPDGSVRSPDAAMVALERLTCPERGTTPGSSAKSVFPLRPASLPSPRGYRTAWPDPGLAPPTTWPPLLASSAAAVTGFAHAPKPPPPAPRVPR
ncbi:MAG: Uma2 family endonuclease, partial [Cyanobium sp.]